MTHLSPAAPLRPERALVTGCAGFIGSHLCERLLAQGTQVVGVDCFTDYYAPARKHANLASLLPEPAFTFSSADLAEAPLDELLHRVDVVYHLAGQPGVRGSFGDGFGDYLRNNLTVTQRLLEHVAEHPVRQFVYASSSSVYGNGPVHPTAETAPRMPASPYGVTKAATEDIAAIYHRIHGVPVVGLRFFTVYGPRQRPDMAFSRFLDRILDDEVLPINGDGRQVRDFTFVDDIVAGTIAAGAHGLAGRVYNLGGGQPVELREVLDLLGELVGRQPRVAYGPPQAGDALRTGADCRLSAEELGFAAATELREGLAQQLEWTLAGRAATPAVALAA